MVEDFCRHLGLIFFLSQQVWSHRFWQVKDVQPASQQDSPNQCEEKHKRHRLCSCRIRNRNWSSSILEPLGWGEHVSFHMQIHGLYLLKCTKLWCEWYPRDITDLGQGVKERYGKIWKEQPPPYETAARPCLPVITSVQWTWIQTEQVQSQGISRISESRKSVVWVEMSCCPLQSKNQKSWGNRTTFCTLGSERRTVRM